MLKFDSKDKGKITILVIISVFSVLLIAAFSTLFILDLTSKESSKNIKTTTRRSIKTTESTKPTTTELTTTENIELTTTETITTTSQIKTTKATTTKEAVTEEVTTTAVVNTRELATSSTTYPEAVDAWEWSIINLINEERRRNGYSELLVASDLRDKAERAADAWYNEGNNAVKEYLTGCSSYRKYSNLSGLTPESLYQSTLEKTNITTRDGYKYIGVGVLKKQDTVPIYYYVVIYE